MKIFNWRKVSIIALVMSFLMISVFGFGRAQSQIFNSTTQKKARLSDKEWADKLFQALIWPLGDEEISILQKQFRLADDQKILVGKLNDGYRLQQQFWNFQSRLSLGEIGSDEKTTRENNEKSKKTITIVYF